jgi:Ser/Thr protein kinase RdoA (MazF antagonist)
VAPAPEPALEPAARAAAERILTDAWGAPVALARADVVWERDHVVRLVADDGRTAILKRVRRDDSAPADEHAHAFAAEQVALALLATTDDPVAPRLLGTDDALGLVIVEELPTGRSLAQSLLGDDTAAAHADLTAYGRAIATMAVHGARHAGEHHELERRVGLPADHAPRAVAWADRQRSALSAALAGLGIDPTATDGELDGVVARIRTGPYQGFVHGDPCPDNVRIVDGRCRVFDFERSSRGSIALDAAHLLAPFPTCWCFAQVPAEAAEVALAAHRAVLASHGIDGGAPWDEALVDALAIWLVARTPLLVEALTADRTWGTTTLRARWSVWTTTFPERAARADVLPRTAATVRALHDALRARWPDVGAPGYPALHRPGEIPVAAPDGWDDA